MITRIILLRFWWMRTWLHLWQTIWKITDATNKTLDRYCIKLEDEACEYASKHDL